MLMKFPVNLTTYIHTVKLVDLIFIVSGLKCFIVSHSKNSGYLGTRDNPVSEVIKLFHAEIS